jgi:hypothetical protein
MQKPNQDKPEKTKDKKQNSNNSKDLICHLSASWRMIFVQRTPVE